jgi:hypothetical protein
MRRLLAVIIFLPLLLMAAVPPRFESFPVEVHPIKKFARTKIPKTGVDWKMDRFLRSSDNEPVTFAGKYTFGEIGCGTGCVEYCLIDRTSGVVYPGQISPGIFRMIIMARPDFSSVGIADYLSSITPSTSHIQST